MSSKSNAWIEIIINIWPFYLEEIVAIFIIFCKGYLCKLVVFLTLECWHLDILLLLTYFFCLLVVSYLDSQLFYSDFCVTTANFTGRYWIQIIKFLQHSRTVSFCDIHYLMLKYYCNKKPLFPLAIASIHTVVTHHFIMYCIA